MRLMRRVLALEGPRPEVVVFLDGMPGNPWRERVAEARRQGLLVRVIRLCVVAVAESVAEAEAIVARYRAKNPELAVTVSRNGEVLAEYKPERPAELRDILTVGG